MNLPVLKLREVHKDPRGFLFEALRFQEDSVPSGGQIYVYSVEPGHRRGDHYHSRKIEWVTCVFGNIVCLTTTTDGKNEAFSLSNEKPASVRFDPGTTHCLYNPSKTDIAIVVSYASEEFHPEDPDTFLKPAFPEYPL